MIFITGCARSGTSLTCQILEKCGLDFGVWKEWRDDKGQLHREHRDYSKDKGLWECTPVRDRFVKMTLAAYGLDPMGQNPLPESPIEQVGFDLVPDITAYCPHVYKDAKLLLMWPAIRKLYPWAKWVLCWRDIEQIVASCQRTPFMQAFKTDEEWRKWATWYREEMFSMQTFTLIDLYAVEPHTAIEGDWSQFQELVEWLGLEWNEEAKDVIKPGEWHT